MGAQGNVDLHFWLTRGMARRLDVNLSEAMHHGLLTQGDFAEMITRCRQCQGAQGCMSYLSEQNGRLAAAPDWCCNRALLDELAQMQ